MNAGHPSMVCLVSAAVSSAGMMGSEALVEAYLES